MYRSLAVLTLVLIAACASTPSVNTAATAPSVGALPRELHWFRNSAEYRAVTLGTFRAAEARITEVARTLEPGTWAVVLDVDETTLDNSEHQRRVAVSGVVRNDSIWYSWVRERAAPAIPGAVEFTNAVRRLGGRVALVSNRDDVVCDATRENVRAVGIAADVVLCRVNRVSDKTPRFNAIEAGTAGIGAARIVMWLGDNIMDFPRLTQASRTDPSAYDPFGTRYFMLPNPLYGSWESNPGN